MRKKTKNTLIVVIIILFLSLLGLIVVLSQRIKPNPPGTVGNTGGNLNNEGLFCEYNGIVYFANALEGGCLCTMNPDETGFQKLVEQNCRNILAGGDYIYFFQSGPSSQSGFGQIQGMKSFVRCKLNGKDFTALTKDVVVTGQLVDNYLYLLTTSSAGPSFYKMTIDQKDKTILSNQPLNPASVQNGVIFYNGTETNHYLYGLNTSTDSPSEIWRGNIWYPVADGDWVYYLDVESNYRLCRYSLSRKEIYVLTDERVDCYNVGNGYIYYQTNGSNPALKCMSDQGGAPITVAEGIFTNINLTSRYVYFQPFGATGTSYHSPLGSGSFSNFIPY